MDIVQYRDCLLWAVQKLAEPIEMQSGMPSRVGLGEDLLRGNVDASWEAALLGIWLIEKHCKAYFLGVG